MHGKTKVVKSDVVKKRDRQTDKTNKMERLEKYGLKTSFDDIFTLNFVFLHVLVFMEVIN